MSGILVKLSGWSRSWKFWVVLHILLFLGLLTVLALLLYPGPGSMERAVALKILDGQIPYHDFPSEYPPLALLSFLAPGLLFSTHIPYCLAFAVEILLFDLAAMFLISLVASHLKISRRRALTVYTLSILAIGPLITIRYDMLPAVLVLGALTSFVLGKNKLAWGALALGFSAKLYPLIIAPLFILYHLRHRQYRQLVTGGFTFLAILLLLTLPWLIIDAPGFWQSLTYHMERGLQTESSYATILLVGQALGLTEVTGEFSFGSWNLVSPLADSLAKASFFISAGFLAVLYSLFGWLLWRKPKPAAVKAPAVPESSALILGYSLLAVTVFLLTSKVLSPQFLIWLCPLLPLLKGRFNYIPWFLFLTAGALTQYVFPYHYIALELGETHPVAIMAARNCLLAIMAVLTIIFSFRPQAKPGQPATSY